MTPLFKKLNLAETRSIHVLNAPASFEAELQALQGVTVQRKAIGQISFALAFVQTTSQVEAATRQLTSAAEGDAVLWMVYPKAASRNLKCEFNRDTGWQALGLAGYEPVRVVAVDADWSALRFRKVAFIKTMKRDPEAALSEAGRLKAGGRRGAHTAHKNAAS